MSKLKDAFAIRDFDAKRILQRSYFCELNLPKNLTDEEILSTLVFDKDTPMDEAEKKLVQLETIADKAEKFSKLIIRHLLKLQKLDGRKQQHKGIITIYLSDGAGRLAKLINAYSEIANNIDFIFCIPLEQKIIELRPVLKKIYNSVFSKKLKKVRQLKGFTQKSLSELLGISQSGIVAYENGQREPSLATARYMALRLGVEVGELI